jgi:hypothetical protein
MPKLVKNHNRIVLARILILLLVLFWHDLCLFQINKILLAFTKKKNSKEKNKKSTKDITSQNKLTWWMQVEALQKEDMRWPEAQKAQ